MNRVRARGPLFVCSASMLIFSAACSGAEPSAEQPNTELPSSSSGAEPSASLPAGGESSAPVTAPEPSASQAGAPASASTSGTGTTPVAPSAPSPSVPNVEPSAAPSVEPSVTAPEVTATTPATTPEAPEEAPPAPVPTLIGDVTFSTPSGTFAGELTVTLAGPDGAEIRYTTDGTVPGAESPMYDGAALVLSATTQIRAQAFTAGSPTGFPSTGLYVARTFDTPSDIPIVIMEGYGGGRPQKEVSFGGNNEEPPPEQPWFDVAFMLFEPVDGVASIADAPTLVTRAGYRERGQSSANAEKSPYRVEFWNNVNEDADYPVLGMPADSDWAMIGEFYDKTQIRNSLVYGWGVEMGLQTLERRFAELYINFDGGPLEESDYFGVYAITETIKNQDDRINIKNLKPEHVAEPEISGGYIMKFDQAALDGGEPVIECTGSGPFGGSGAFGGGGMQEDEEEGHCFQYLGIVDPEVVNAEQLAWITQYVQAFHDSIHTAPLGDYAQYIDVPSFVDHLIIGELTRNVDAFVRSHYFTKDREGLLKAGPLWDYNFSLDSIGSDVEGWHAQSQAEGRGNDDWFWVLEQDPAFIAQTAARWRELRQGIFADEAVQAQITEFATPLASAGPRDLARWPAEGGGLFGGGGGGEEEATPETYEGHLDVLREWIPQRMLWLDEAFSAY